MIGATGTIGRAIAAALYADNEILSANLRSAAIKVDIADPASIRHMYSLGKLNAAVCAAGQAKFAPLAELGDADFRFCLDNKVMRQVNAVRCGFVRAAALEAPRKIRVNSAVGNRNAASAQDGPILRAAGRRVAQAYLRSVSGGDMGSTLKP